METRLKGPRVEAGRPWGGWDQVAEVEVARTGWILERF